MKRKVTAVAITSAPYLGRAMAALTCMCTVSAFIYGVFLLEAVAHAASRTSAERQTREITVELNVLEAQYLTDTQSLTPERASALGYVEPKEVSTVFATAASRSLSLRAQ